MKIFRKKEKLKHFLIIVNDKATNKIVVNSKSIADALDVCINIGGLEKHSISFKDVSMQYRVPSMFNNCIMSKDQLM